MLAPAPVTPHATPLLELPVPEAPAAHVLVKDETRYASGSHKEPAARVVVAAAARAGCERVVVATCGNYGRAVAAAAPGAGLRATVVLPVGWSDGGVAMRAAGAEVVLVAGSYEDAVEESRRLAAGPGAIDGNVDGPLVGEVLTGHGLVVDALAAALGTAPDAVWVPVGNGTTAIAVRHRAVELGWPTVLHAVGATGQNPVVTSWPGPYRPLAAAAVVTTEHNQPLVNWHALQGAEAMAAVAASGGRVHGVDDTALVAARDRLAVVGAFPTAAGAVALAGLLADVEALRGTHVVVLSGRTVTA